MCFWYFVGVSRWKEFHLLEQMDQNWILSAGESIELNLFPSWGISQLSRKIKRRRNITFDQPTPGMTMAKMNCDNNQNDLSKGKTNTVGHDNLKLYFFEGIMIEWPSDVQGVCSPLSEIDSGPVTTLDQHKIIIWCWSLSWPSEEFCIHC